MTYSEMKAQLDGLRQKKRLLRSLQRQLEEARAQIDCLAGVDYGKCTGCGKCVEVCPAKCILPLNLSAAQP